MVPDLPRGSCSVSYHPMSLQNRPRPLSFLSSNLHVPNQASLLQIKPSCSKIFGSTMSPILPRTVRSECRVRYPLGYSPKRSLRPINLRFLLENSSRYLDSATWELPSWRWRMDSANFPIAFLLGVSYPVSIPSVRGATAFG